VETPVPTSSPAATANPCAQRTDRPELLAPAGDWEAMRAAVSNGADAVYFGLSDFNARHRATNFTTDELPDVMAYLHTHNVRGYVTFNTLVFSDELTKAAQFIAAVAAAGVDAAIVQDLGLTQLIRRIAPTLAIHGSTQMTLTEPRGVAFVKALGVERVILARELSAQEIGKIAGKAPLPVEVFIHGALCVSYSGQCLTSESLGGRSANRGQCAQACRLPYELIVDNETRDLGDKSYLLSPQDLAAYDMIDELLEQGVISFKIEGRLKSAHYVAATTQAYRAAIDAAVERRPFTLPRQQEIDLKQSFSRGFTHGFLSGVDHQQLVHGRFPKARGIRIGIVASFTDEGFIVEVDAESRGLLQAGDGVVFDEGHPDQDEQGGRVFNVRPVRWESPRGTQKQGIPSGNRLDADERADRIHVTLGQGDVNLSAVAEGCIVWRTDDPAMRRRLSQSFNREVIARRVELHADVHANVGGPLTITLRDDQRHAATVTWPGPLQAAMKHPLSEPLLRDQLGRLGDTPFELTTIQIIGNNPGVMAPKSVLNDLRRQAAEQLVTMRSTQAKHAVADAAAVDSLRQRLNELAPPGPAARGLAGSPPEHQPTPSPRTPSLHILVRSLEQLDAALTWKSPDNLPGAASVYCDFEDVRQYKQAVASAKAAGVPVALATVRVIKPAEEGLLRQVAACEPDFVLVRNLAGLSLMHEEAPHIPLIADYALNVANELTAALIAAHGVIRMTPSYDLNWAQMQAFYRQIASLRGAAGRVGMDLIETVVHQHMPMFHMEHCVFAATMSTGKDFHDCGRPCESHKVKLRDRVGQEHPLLADVGCRNTLFNAQAQSAATYIPRMKQLGLHHFRIEVLRESADETRLVLDRYGRLLADLDEPDHTRRSLNVLSQLGVTSGTMNFE
jgi:putative protease